MSRKSFFSHLYMILASFLLMACQSDEVNAMPPADINNTTDGDTKTLIVYYSYTNHTEQIVADLRTLINADVSLQVRVGDGRQEHRPYRVKCQ